MSYSRVYENISFKYSLPSRMFHPSHILKVYVDKIASVYGIAPEDVIDAYVKLYLRDLEKNVTRMIYHDGNQVTSQKFPYCIIEEMLDEEKIIEENLRDE